MLGNVSNTLYFTWQQSLIQNSPAEKRVWPQKGRSEKRCEIQSGGQEMTVMVG